MRWFHPLAASAQSRHKVRNRISVQSVQSVVHSVSIKHEELTGQIIGAAMAVLNELKPGLDEKLYEIVTICLNPGFL